MRALVRLHQLLLILAILSGCYAPDVRDCTVTCSAATDCTGGQVCGNDGFCAAEGVAGTCGPGGVDAGTTRVILHVQVDGSGKVEIDGAGSCNDGGPSDCLISVLQGPVVIHAIATHSDKPFDHWLTANCAGQTTTCMFNASSSMPVGVKFR